MSVDLNKLWFLSLEIEGLISVLKDKDEAVLNAALPHLEEKISQLSDAIRQSHDIQTAAGPCETVSATLSVTDIEPQPAHEGYVEYPKTVIVIESRPTPAETSETDDSGEMIAESAEFEESEDADTSDSPEADVNGDESEKHEEKPEPQPDEPIRIDKKLSRTVASDIRKAFTINDKFLYRRELFGNSNQQYNDALDLIAEMSSFEEAESYFFGNYGWDPENAHVKRFMEIIENYFAS